MDLSKTVVFEDFQCFFGSSSVDLTKGHNGETTLGTKFVDIRRVIGANVSEIIYYDVLLQNKLFWNQFEFAIRC